MNTALKEELEESLPSNNSSRNNNDESKSTINMLNDKVSSKPNIAPYFNTQIRIKKSVDSGVQQDRSRHHKTRSFFFSGRKSLISNSIFQT
jgi:hypothetical protein